ncbi:cytidine deaminase [Calorimonas adulescens]|jgi:cytidine deaminase (EC 3.5.4.5)|uniref:Cytidine deaminase n=1 Tax=Calorimonas adulescens TaxID=2606906 RepID=A0A5D8QDF8_9THEO|nr:cytidine deaminase [Calorimonas adulescens]TZE81856.1 cytidine deaminase [Calorimonas adulescens]
MDKRELMIVAEKAKEMAYAPYSNFKVGAALLAKDGVVFTGCNVENASYGATCCAERVAIFKAVSDGYKDFEAIAISGGKKFTYPCGICRQVLVEFNPDMRVIIGESNGELKEYKASELLPEFFGPKELK